MYIYERGEGGLKAGKVDKNERRSKKMETFPQCVFFFWLWLLLLDYWLAHDSLLITSQNI